MHVGAPGAGLALLAPQLARLPQPQHRTQATVCFLHSFLSLTFREDAQAAMDLYLHFIHFQPQYMQYEDLVERHLAELLGGSSAGGSGSGIDSSIGVGSGDESRGDEAGE